MAEINYEWFIRTPFAVEATQITAENIEELAQLIGEVKTKGDEKYIALDRRVVPNVARAYIGYWVTRLGDNLRCYSPKIFKEQFITMPEEQPVGFAFSYGGDLDPSVSVYGSGSEANEHTTSSVEPVTVD